MAMTSQSASEHLRDGVDCISECLKTIERVRKNLPELATQIMTTSAKLREARTELQSLDAQLTTVASSTASA